jgi:peptide/nickel transport system substrate-binding protein
MLLRLEPQTITSRVTGGGERGPTNALFNAGLSYRDGQEVAHPYLAEQLPQLGTNSWRIFPDGRSETVYRLKPGLVWHDGTPLTAEDFVFARRVVTDPASMVFSLANEDRQIDEVVADDARTVRFVWKGSYRDAAELSYDPLPRHVLQASFEHDDPSAFANHSYWTTEYQHLGPYRMQRWESGAFIEAAGFERHALGAPRISQVKVIWSADANSAVANLLAGEAHIALGNALPFASASILRRAWASSNAGTVLLSPIEVRYLQIQARPEVARPRAILDVEVRRALAHAIDKPSLTDALLEGTGSHADTFVATNAAAFPIVDRAITRYPYDVRRTEQILAEAGFRKGADGVYADASGRLDPELRGRAGQEDQEATIVVDGWRRAGVDASLNIVSAAQTANNEFRSLFPGFGVSFTGVGGNTALTKLITAAIPRPTNRWVGNNRGGWSSAEFDRLTAEFDTMTERDKASDVMARAMKLLSEEVPAIPLYYSYEAAAHVAALRGPEPVAPESTNYKNVHLWEWR